MVIDLPVRIEMHAEIIREIAEKNDMRPSLIAAIIFQESGGKPQAIEFTPGYRYLLTPKHFANVLNIKYNDEVHGQKSSYGLMQIKCSTARELGFFKVCRKLFEPYTNIFFGTRYLAILKRRYRSDANAISAYNQGQPFRNKNGSYRNSSYVLNVQKFDRRFSLFLNRKKNVSTSSD